MTGTLKTKTALNTETATNFPDNTSGLITPLLLRSSIDDYVASWQQGTSVNAQTGTTYNVVADDYGKLVTLSNGSPVTVNLPQATGTFATFNAYFINLGAGSATLTPATSTINGSATLVLATGQGVQVVSDGTNYQIFPGPPPATSSFNQPAFNNVSLAASVSSNILTVALKDAAGNDPTPGSPCQIAFRSSTASAGTLAIRSVTAALSINTNAVGATLGSVNNTAFRLWVVAFDNGGTVVLGLYNASTATSVKAINEDAVQSSTAISGSATAAQTFYTPNGTTLTNKAVRILGYVEYSSTGLATAGTYATAPNFINVMGSGSKRPGDTLQVATATGTPSDTTASATYVTTSTSVTLTPASAANPILLMANGRVFKNTASSGSYRMSRGTTNNTNMIGTENSVNFAGTGNTIPMTLIAIDLPNTNASQAYATQFKSADANTTAWGGGNTVMMTATELMG